MLEFTIPINPVTKKNSQDIVYVPCKKKSYIYVLRDGKFIPVTPVITQGKTYKKYEKECKPYIPKLEEPLNGPLEVRYLFYRKDNRACDLTNLEEALDDILVKYGVIADDNYKLLVSHDGSRVFVDKENPRTEVRIGG